MYGSRADEEIVSSVVECGEQDRNWRGATHDVLDDSNAGFSD